MVIEKGEWEVEQGVLLGIMSRRRSCELFGSFTLHVVHRESTIGRIRRRGVLFSQPAPLAPLPARPQAHNTPTPFTTIPPPGLEPGHLAPEASALSSELRGRKRREIIGVVLNFASPAT